MPNLITYPPALLRREDAAEYLGISVRKLAQLQARSEIIPVDADGLRLFRRTDLDAWAAARPEWEDR